MKLPHLIPVPCKTNINFIASEMRAVSTLFIFGITSSNDGNSITLVRQHAVETYGTYANISSPDILSSFYYNF